MRVPILLALLPLLAASSARAGTLVSENTTKPYPGVSLTARVESGPNNHIWIAKVSLCSSYVHVDATKAPSSTQTPGAWANSIGAQLATNGDFYTGTQVYGDAVGGGVPWPLAKTGKDKTTAWYYDHYGWIAFGPDWVEFNHTERTKTADASKFGIGFGFKPTEVSHEIPKGTLALVSGFPELVIEGQVYTCSSPTASSCFPDRTDMRARNPRTAMGISKDRKTFILVVVDGRTTASAGMYGSELAELMGKVGAWEAFNIDGGGSSSMWLKSQGTVNNASGNNSGNGVRAVANHWGVFAGSGQWQTERPGQLLRARRLLRDASAGRRSRGVQGHACKRPRTRRRDFPVRRQHHQWLLQLAADVLPELYSVPRSSRYVLGARCWDRHQQSAGDADVHGRAQDEHLLRGHRGSSEGRHHQGLRRDDLLP